MNDILKNFKPTKATMMTDPKKSMEILGYIQVSKGEHLFRNLYVVSLIMGDKEEEYYLVQADTLPDYRVWCGYSYMECELCKGERVSKSLSQAFALAIGDYKEEESKASLNPYSYLYGHIKAQGFGSLHDMWSFEIK
jgi:hypothetical protein